MENFDWELLAKLLAGIVAVFGVLLKFRDFNPRKRLLLKTDLEILKELKMDDPNYSIIESYIDRHTKSIYETNNRLVVYSYYGLVLGILFSLGFAYWSVSLYNSYNGFSFWLVLTSVGILFGITLLVGAFQEDEKGEVDKKLVDEKISKQVDKKVDTDLNAKIGSLIMLIGLFTTIYFHYFYSSINWWSIISAVSILIGLITILNSVSHAETEIVNQMIQKEKKEEKEIIKARYVRRKNLGEGFSAIIYFIAWIVYLHYSFSGFTWWMIIPITGVFFSSMFFMTIDATIDKFIFLASFFFSLFFIGLTIHLHFYFQGPTLWMLISGLATLIGVLYTVTSFSVYLKENLEIEKKTEISQFIYGISLMLYFTSWLIYLHYIFQQLNWWMLIPAIGVLYGFLAIYDPLSKNTPFMFSSSGMFTFFLGLAVYFHLTFKEPILWLIFCGAGMFLSLGSIMTANFEEKPPVEVIQLRVRFFAIVIIFFSTWIVYLHYMFNGLNWWMLIPCIGLAFGVYPFCKYIIFGGKWLAEAKLIEEEYLKQQEHKKRGKARQKMKRNPKSVHRKHKYYGRNRGVKNKL